MKKSMITASLALLLMTTLVVGAALAADLTADTTATVQFTEGGVEFGNVVNGKIDSLDFNFGSHPLPFGAQNYANEATGCMLQINDARGDGKTGSWDVTVAMSSFEQAPKTFVGHVQFKNLSTSAQISVPQTALTADVAVPNLDVSVTSVGTKIMEATMAATGTSRKGVYTLSWTTPANICLTIDEANANLISVAGSYTADMTWTLNVGPMGP